VENDRGCRLGPQVVGEGRKYQDEKKKKTKEEGGEQIHIKYNLRGEKRGKLQRKRTTFYGKNMGRRTQWMVGKERKNERVMRW